ncbi:MAG TPA: transglutaminase domain-containing protein [Desulfuromonadales bacterium]|nr:transglutaminase domain-containing protein [Desulfuromonadales bacterium]
MNYNWAGDVILHNCAVDHKRFVLGSKKPIRTDIREFVSPADDVVIKETLNLLANEMNLPTTKSPGDFDRRALIIWDYVARGVRYQFDAKRQRKGDFWLFPSETITLRFGDCEDASFLLASLLIGSGISPFNVRVTLGELHESTGKSLGGHCWVMYKSELGRWCLLESTVERAPGSLQPADRIAANGLVNYVPHFCFNNVHLWSIRHDAVNYADIQSYLKNPKMRLVNLADPAFPSGGLISMLTGDNSPGHLELTQQVMKMFGFSEDAIDIAADAAQDPDFYEWDTPSAHAQTKSDDKTGKTMEDQNAAIDNYRDWIACRKNQLLQQKKPEFKLFFIGYLLHAIQDLASHQGLTNAQHAYESYIDPVAKKVGDCDHSPKNREIAIQYSHDYLDKLLATYPDLAKLKKYKGGFSLLGHKVSKDDKERLLDKEGWDLSIGKYTIYKDSAEAYAKVMSDNPRITWPCDGVFADLLATV